MGVVGLEVEGIGQERKNGEGEGVMGEKSACTWWKMSDYSVLSL